MDEPIRLKLRADQLDNSFALKRAREQGVIQDFVRENGKWRVTIPNGNYALLSDREVMFLTWGIGITNSWAYDRGSVSIDDLYPPRA